MSAKCMICFVDLGKGMEGSHGICDICSPLWVWEPEEVSTYLENIVGMQREGCHTVKARVSIILRGLLKFGWKYHVVIARQVDPSEGILFDVTRDGVSVQFALVKELVMMGGTSLRISELFDVLDKRCPSS